MNFQASNSWFYFLMTLNLIYGLHLRLHKNIRFEAWKSIWKWTKRTKL